MFFQKIRKLTIGFILSVFVVSSLAGFVISAQPANAQLSTIVAGDIPAQATGILDMIKNGWKIAVLNAAQQAVSYFLRKVAYDSAVWLASGGKGQNPYADTKGFGDYMSSVGSNAAGTAIEQLGTGFGLDLCKIPDVKIDLALRIGLHYNYALGSEPRAPACNLKTFQENWGGDAWASKYGDGKGGFDTNKVFNKSLGVDDAPLGIALKTTEKIDRLVAKQTNAAQADRVEGQGFKAATKLISGDVKTPSQVIKKEAEANSPSEQNKKSEAQIAAAMGAGAYEIIPSTLSLFLNTLSGQMLKNFKENGMLPGGICVGGYGGPDCKDNGGSQAQNFDAGSLSMSGRAAAEATFSEFLVTKLDVLSNYDLLPELSSCNSQGLYNCRIDQGLVQALTEANNGQPVTIREAMSPAKGWLHPEAKLIPPSRTADNAIQKCYNDPQKYCYSNLAVLRQLRILPLGLEIAAKNSDPDNPWSLKEVVDGFYNCSYNKDGSVNYDPENKPFCHLVDPNWVIKLAKTRCDAKAPGSIPLGSDVPDRVEECVDVKTCVGQDKDGNCAGYGNCVREKNVWKFDAKECSAQYATCRSFTNNSGKSVSYLYRTLDTGDCSQDTAGCKAYSLEQDNAGKWKEIAKTNYGNYSTGVYLNKNVSTACSASSVGCSAFKLSGDTSANNFIPLKKAPDYLHCYDSDADQTNGIQWPQTFSDIFKMQPRPECKNYAQVCIADEVGCANYQSADDPQALAIPGKFTPAVVASNTIQSWNDQCDARCAGYAAYREMPSNFASDTPLTYIIPPSKYNKGESGTTCTADEVSCSSFTNMASTEGGGEKVEYFTDLRACIKPDINKQKNYYTYEGSVVGGYQLKAYVLEKNTTDDEDKNVPGLQVGGMPATVFVNAQDKIDAMTYKCNADLYKAGQADVDCRQFNDDKGTIYYALLSHTIVVSADCAQYRLNSAELASSGQCFSNGEYKDGVCYYNGLPTGVTTNVGSSQTCSAAAVSCREYKGNNGNNIKTVLVENFENQSNVTAVNGWSSVGGTISWSAESTHVGEHSLGYTGLINNTVQKTINLKADSLDLQNNMSYGLSFWAKGNGANVDVFMTDSKGQSVKAGTITANTSWQNFRFNLLELSSSGTSTVNFTLKSGGSLFLDNIRLTKVSEFLYLVKDSLKVDPICDDNQNDNLPGEALGCSAYNGPKNSLGDNLYYLTNFSFLCREGAIGCTSFKDTFNKISGGGPRAYNVSLTGITGTKVTTKVGNDSYSCQIEQGKTSCYVNVKGYTKDEIEKSVGAQAAFVPSTYFIPADTVDAFPVYLVADQSVSCNAADLGCTVAGIQKSTPSGNQFEDTVVKFDPSLLEAGTDISGNPTPGILCHQQALGCGVYGSSQGEAYFKDPALIGAKVCVFQPSVTKDNNKVSGWFWKDVGVCGNTSTPSVISLPKTSCVSADDCSGGNVCVDTNIQPCYPNYLQNGNSYGLWSYGNKDKYENFVGECPAEQNACTEFVDHADFNKAYYFLKDNKISEGDCGGMASQKAGCAIFDQTDNPNKFWNTAATYVLSDYYIPGKNSDLSKVTKVQPVEQKEKNDANILIKVKRDRECAEWLQCASSHSVFNAITNKPKNVCDAVGLCNQAGSTGDINGTNINNCVNFVDKTSSSSSKILTEQDYVQRNITWEGKDWAGYSILGKYPVDEFSQVRVGGVTSTTWTLAKKISCVGNCLSNNNVDDSACKIDTKIQPCGKNNSGSCINGICLQNLDGTPINNIAVESLSTICRAYPEKDSPFPISSKQKTSIDYKSVNYCNEAADKTKYGPCDCDYVKVSYGTNNINRYFSLQHIQDYNSGICVGGSKDGKDCSYDDVGLKKDCPDPGDCQILKKDTLVLGWRGYCLEEDLSRTLSGDANKHPCLTWYPVDKLSGVKDIDYQHKEAGFIGPANGGYCYKGNLFAEPIVASVDDNSVPPKKICTDPTNYSLSKDDAWCISNFKVPYANGFLNNFGTFSNGINNYGAGCEKIVKIGDDLVVATNEIWNKDNSVAQNRKSTPVSPFAVITGFNPKSFSQLPFCKEAPWNYFRPSVDKDGALYCPEKSLPNGPQVGGVLQGNSYNNWAFNNGTFVFNPGSLDPKALCGSDEQCKIAGGDALLHDFQNPKSYCAIPCTADTEKQICGTNKCINASDKNGKNISFCSGEAVTLPYGKYNYASIYADYPLEKDSELSDLCSPGFSVNFTDGSYITNVGVADTPKLNFYKVVDGQSVQQKGYIDDKVNKSCVDSGGLFCVNQAKGYLVKDLGAADFFGGIYAYPNPVSCETANKPGVFVAFSTTTVRAYDKAAEGGFYKGSIVTEVCGSDKTGLSVGKCQNRKIPLPSNGENFQMDNFNVIMCSNQPGPNLIQSQGGTVALGDELKDLIVSAPKSLTYTWNYKDLKSIYKLDSWDWNNTNNLNPNNNGGGPPTSYAPIVHPVSSSCSSDYSCAEIDADGLTINNQWNKDVLIKSKSEPVVMKFYVSADKNHMPLRQMSIDWDDGSNPIDFSDVYIKNQKSPGNCDGSDFGRLDGITCDVSYSNFDKTFKCKKGITRNFDKAKSQGGYTDDCPDKENFPGGCCVFKPYVQVKDNWGWCNGICLGGNDKTNGCYDDNVNGANGTDECIKYKNTTANTKFKANILVAPSK